MASAARATAVKRPASMPIDTHFLCQTHHRHAAAVADRNGGGTPCDLKSLDSQDPAFRRETDAAQKLRRSRPARTGRGALRHAAFCHAARSPRPANKGTRVPVPHIPKTNAWRLPFGIDPAKPFDMDALLWLAMIGIYVLCAWMWFSEFGKQFPRPRHPRRRTPGWEITSTPYTSFKPWIPTRS